MNIFPDMGLAHKNHKTLHFRLFLAKTNDSIFHKSPKTLFLPFLGSFCPKSREREFSQIWNLHRKLANHKMLHFLAKTNDSIFRKSPKTLFLGLFGPLYCPTLHPFLGMKEWDREKIVHINLKVHFTSYSNMKSDFQNL